MTDIIFLVGRLLLGGYFLINGINHFRQMNMLSGYAGSKKVPYPNLAVGVSGILLLIGGLGILLGVYIEWAVLALVLFFIPVSVMLHNFWAATDPQTKMTDTINFTKNMALMGAVLMLLSIPTPWPLSL